MFRRKPVRAANDADIQGLGAVSGRGVDLVLVLGTGFGSSLFVDGTNVEAGTNRIRKSERSSRDENVPRGSLSSGLGFDQLFASIEPERVSVRPLPVCSSHP